MKTLSEQQEDYVQWERDQEASIYNLVEYILDTFFDSSEELEELLDTFIKQKQFEDKVKRGEKTYSEEVALSTLERFKSYE